MHNYQQLDAVAVKATADRLCARIALRFPERNLAVVAREITTAIDEMTARPTRGCTGWRCWPAEPCS